MCVACLSVAVGTGVERGMLLGPWKKVTPDPPDENDGPRELQRQVNGKQASTHARQGLESKAWPVPLLVLWSVLHSVIVASRVIQLCHVLTANMPQ